MTGAEIAHRRLHSQRLAGSPLPGPADVVDWLGAVQSQEYTVANWSLGQRATGTDDAAVSRALADGTILRTHLLRPTWHFVLPADIRWMQDLTAPRVHAFNAYYYRQLGLDDELLARTNALLVDLLAGGNHLTRREVGAALAGAGIAADGMRLAYIIMRAELDALICSGPMRGRQHTYALVAERAPDARSRSADEALAELTRRYFTSHGPATVKDLKWWSSLTVAQIRRGLDLVGPELVSEEIGGRTYWSAPATVPHPEPSPTVHLIQPYDEYVVAYTESRDVVDVSGATRAALQSGVLFANPIVLDGQLVGSWRRTLTKTAVTVDPTLFVPLDAAQKDALEAAVDRFGRFLGVPARLA